MAEPVNLDPLIPREDIDYKSAVVDEMLHADYYRLSDLDPEGIVWTMLRKPDFQRETNAWGPKKVVELILSFLNGDLIPAVILWRNPTTRQIFVVDGAHRLSALMAWTFDDYGDGDISKKFFNGRIPTDQQKIAIALRKAILKEIGTYKYVRQAAKFPNDALPNQVEWSQNLPNTLRINLQWVNGDFQKAEKSFKAINDKATPIDKTEAKMLAERKMPTGMASRAIVHSGTGHQYWGHFDRSVIDSIGKISTHIHDLLFEPELTEPLRLSVLPIAGKAYSGEGVKLVCDLVDFSTRRLRQGGPERIVGGVKIPSLKKQVEDVDGRTTLDYLKAVKKTVELITGESPSSLGLHPAVYYYSVTGKRQPTALFATIRLTEELQQSGRLSKFTHFRATFEEFLVKYKDFVNRIVKEFGAEERSLPSMYAMLDSAYQAATTGIDVEGIKESIVTQERFKFLAEPEQIKKGKGEFSSIAKNVVYLQAAINSAHRCSCMRARKADTVGANRRTPLARISGQHWRN